MKTFDFLINDKGDRVAMSTAIEALNLVGRELATYVGCKNGSWEFEQQNNRSVDEGYQAEQTFFQVSDDHRVIKCVMYITLDDGLQKYFPISAAVANSNTLIITLDDDPPITIDGTAKQRNAAYAILKDRLAKSN